MKSKQPTFFDEQRMNWTEALELTRQSLAGWGERYRHWALAWSGGKDSSAALAAVVYLIESGGVPRPETFTILRSDTRLELTPLDASAQQIMAKLEAKRFTAKTVLPAMDDRYFVYMLGRGVPPPSNTFRWCELRPLYAELKKPCNRIRKDGTESRKDGSLVANPCRMGPLTLEARLWALDRVLDIQARAGVDLINAEEEARIRELIAAKTWPRGWDGTEPLASLPFANVNPDGSVQPIFEALLR